MVWIEIVLLSRTLQPNLCECNLYLVRVLCSSAQVLFVACIQVVYGLIGTRRAELAKGGGPQRTDLLQALLTSRDEDGSGVCVCLCLSVCVREM